MDNLSERAMLVSLELSSWSGRCVDKAISESVILDHSAEKDSGRFYKRLIAKDKLKEIGSIHSEARKVFKEMTLAWDDRKYRLLSSDLFVELSNKLNDLKAEHDAAVSTFIINYEDYITESRQALNGMFDINDYPRTDELGDKFDFKFTFEPLAAPGDFRCSIDDNIKEKIKADIQKRTEEKYTVAIKRLWKRVQRVVAKFNEKLADQNGKFKNSLVENISDLLELLPALNIMDDPALTSMAKQIQSQLCSLDPDTLRQDPEVRRKAVIRSQNILETIGNLS